MISGFPNRAFEPFERSSTQKRTSVAASPIGFAGALQRVLERQSSKLILSQIPKRDIRFRRRLLQRLVRATSTIRLSKLVWSSDLIPASWSLTWNIGSAVQQDPLP